MLVEHTSMLAEETAMPEPHVQELYFESLKAYDASPNPQDKLLRSFNVFKAARPNELLMSLKPCVEADKAIPAKYISSSTSSQGFKSTYEERSSSREVKRDFSASVGIEGSYGVFSASLQVDYSKSEATASTAFYSSYKAQMNVGTLVFQASNEDTLALLNPAMVKELKAIDSMAKAHAFTETWGTHLVTRVNLGGMLFVTIQAETSSREDKERLGATLKAKYGGAIGSLSAAASMITEMRSSSSTKSVTQEVVALGGLATKAATIDPDNKSTYQAWIDTCTENTVYAVSETKEIYTLVSGTPRDLLKKYIDLKMLAFSLEHPTVFVEEKRIDAYTTNAITAPATYTKGYKIIGGGAAATLGCSSYLHGSYPQVESGSGPTGWHATSHDMGIPASGGDTLSAYAIAVYDPENYLDVTVATAKGKNKGEGGDEADATIPDGWVLTCGGTQFNMVNSPGKMVMGSYFKNAKTWSGGGSDYMIAAVNAELTVYAIGIKSRDEHLKISATYISGAESYGQSGRAVANAQSCICGGGVRVWNTGSGRGGNLVQKTFPVSPTGWAEVNNDMLGNICNASFRAFAIALNAEVV